MIINSFFSQSYKFRLLFDQIVVCNPIKINENIMKISEIYFRIIFIYFIFISNIFLTTKIKFTFSSLGNYSESNSNFFCFLFRKINERFMNFFNVDIF